MKRKLLVIIPAVLLLLIAGCVTVYPLVANYVNDKYQSVVRKDYAREIEEMDTSTLDAARAAAQAYNDNLSPLRYNKEAVQLASVEYDSLLNLNGSGIMGYVEIPKLNVNLPIYHGTGEQVLEKGVGHLTGSSLPIGGEGCHPILTGHSGVAGKRLFSDLDQLHAGDVFYLHILGDTLAYQVARITTELNNLREANQNYDELERLKKVAADYAETRDAVIHNQLLAIESAVNQADHAGFPDAAFSDCAGAKRTEEDSLSRSAALLCKPPVFPRRQSEGNSGMVGSQRHQHDQQHLHAPGLQLQSGVRKRDPFLARSDGGKCGPPTLGGPDRRSRCRMT